PQSSSNSCQSSGRPIPGGRGKTSLVLRFAPSPLAQSNLAGSSGRLTTVALAHILASRPCDTATRARNVIHPRYQHPYPYRPQYRHPNALGYRSGRVGASAADHSEGDDDRRQRRRHREQ
ncbi:hypothetical protein BJV74DRAFT_954592, partial [Russula compacta]